MKDFNFSNRKFLIRPYTYINSSLFNVTIRSIILLMIQVVMLVATKSYSSVFIVLTAVAASVMADAVWAKVTQTSVLKNHSLLVSILQGLIAGLLIPQGYPLIPVFFVIFFTMIIVKYFFGGFAYSWANPAVFAVIVLWIIGTEFFPLFQVTFDTLAMRNPSLSLIEGGTIPLVSFDSSVTDFFNNTVFSLFKVSVPEGYVSFFWDNHSVIPAFRFNFITLVSSVFLFSENSVDLIIPSVFLCVYALLVRLVSPFFYSGLLFQGDILLALLTGGTFFCAFFILNAYAMIPITVWGKAIYAFLAAVTMFFVAGCGTSSSGMIFTVIISNVFSVMIQQFESYFDRKLLQKKLEDLKNQYDSELQEI